MSTYIEIWRPNESIEGWFDHEHCKSSVMGRDGLYQGCTGQPLFCFGAGRGRRKNRGGAGQGREQNPRGGARTVEPYQGIFRVGQKDHKPISWKSGSVSFFNKCEFFCRFLSTTWCTFLVEVLAGRGGACIPGSYSLDCYWTTLDYLTTRAPPSTASRQYWSIWLEKSIL